MLFTIPAQLALPLETSRKLNSKGKITNFFCWANSSVAAYGQKNAFKCVWDLCMERLILFNLA